MSEENLKLPFFENHHLGWQPKDLSTFLRMVIPSNMIFDKNSQYKSTIVTTILGGLMKCFMSHKNGKNNVLYINVLSGKTLLQMGLSVSELPWMIIMPRIVLCSQVAPAVVTVACNNLYCLHTILEMMFVMLIPIFNLLLFVQSDAALDQLNSHWSLLFIHVYKDSPGYLGQTGY